MSVATGVAVASNYYAQPLLHTIADAFGVPFGQVGMVVTAAQLSYAAGLILLVPLGDLFERRRLIVVMSLLSAGGLVISACAPSLAGCWRAPRSPACSPWSPRCWCRSRPRWPRRNIAVAWSAR